MILSKMRTHIKWVLVLFCLIFIVSIFFTYGLGDRRSSNSEGQVRDHVVAVVDGKKLYLSDLHKRMQAWAANTGFTVTEDNIHEAYKSALDDLVANIALDKEIKARGVGADPAMVDARLKQLEAQFVTKEQFMQHLAYSGSSIEKLKESLARQVAVEEVLRQGAGEYTPDEEQMKQLYDVLKTMNHEVVYRGAGIEGHHAEVKSEEKAKELVTLLRGGTPYKEAIAKIGADMLSVHTDGDYTSYISDATLKSSYADSLAKLSDGQVSDPVALGNGTWLVYQRLRHEDARYLSYDDAKPVLAQLIRAQEMPMRQQAFLKTLSEQVPLEIKDSAVFEPKAPAGEGDQAAEAQGQDQAVDQADVTPAEDPASGEAPASAPAPKSETKKTSGETKTLASHGGKAATDKIDLSEVNKRPAGGLVTAEGAAKNTPLPKLPSSAGERKTVGGN